MVFYGGKFRELEGLGFWWGFLFEGLQKGWVFGGVFCLRGWNCGFSFWDLVFGLARWSVGRFTVLLECLRCRKFFARLVVPRLNGLTIRQGTFAGNWVWIFSETKDDWMRNVAISSDHLLTTFCVHRHRKAIALMIAHQRPKVVEMVGREVINPRGLIGLNKDFVDYCGDEIAQVRIEAHKTHK